MDNRIVFRDVTKMFGEKRALDGVDIAFNTGEIHAVLGPNGSGKTTMLRIASGISRQTSGMVSVFGLSTEMDALKIRGICGMVEENPALYSSMTVGEYIDFLVSVRNIDRNEASERSESLMKGFELGKYYGELIGSLSFGTKQKVAIMAALLHNPMAIFLDEAYKGLDPHSFNLLKRLMISLARSGRLIVFSTHIIEIAEAISDRLSVILNGKIIFSDTFARLRENAAEKGVSTEDLFLSMTGQADVDRLQNEMMRHFNEYKF
ncbi:MAG: ABC transporter ATP-binding protein [Candidatus Thermoplasmatota archaeon]|nr:ABC transporter ATP-binding protein [Candidatus Thermoplasmatota archaeon]MCL5731583.1 ABC transporter ATP-binding protein [Candidatus Thermoplasmatota archaeon]